jgi:G3E family GTPase
MTLLSGFLGSGKTSALLHLLQNKEGYKIGVIVNDVASVNIDGRLISSQTADGIIELQNGCACCSLADELLTSVDRMLSKGKKWDALVVELSGVADPIAIKSNWQLAKMQRHPATMKTDLSRVVTLVDACTFGTDWMTFDQAGSRWTDTEDCVGQRAVTELLAEQVEAADLILVNKVDLASEDQVAVASTVARGLNEKADVEEVAFGRISSQLILGGKQREAVEKHSHDDHAESCADPDCTDPSHTHQHLHDHAACSDPSCADESHSHNHSHEHSHNHDCEDPDCVDTSHSHSHSHATSTDQLGITSFVYKRDRPFNAKRLLDLLNQWPVPIKDDLDITLLQQAQEGGYSIAGKIESGSPFVGVLRSKGFIWIAPNQWMGANSDAYRHETAMYWSHAGKHFGITAAGKWWGTIPKDQMKQYFPNDPEEYERILREDFVSTEWGDRRQEVVFIGISSISEEDISEKLDKCLLQKHEMERYRKDVNNYNQMMLNMD